jgi:type VI secretion system protein ImpE
LDLKACLQDGDLTRAVELATNQVKGAPLDAGARLALFQTLCFSGDLDRALKQLDIVADESMEKAFGATALKALLDGELHRRQVLSGYGTPDFLGEDNSWAALLLHAIKEPAAPEELEKARGAISGTLNGEPFTDFRDGDDLLGSVLEFSVAGRYVWLRWSQVKSLTAKQPSSLLDLCWLPVDLELVSGERTNGVIPVLYFNSYQSDDDKLKLGHATDWREDNGIVRGIGRRILYADGAEVDMLAMRELKIPG